MLCTFSELKRFSNNLNINDFKFSASDDVKRVYKEERKRRGAGDYSGINKSQEVADKRAMSQFENVEKRFGSNVANKLLINRENSLGEALANGDIDGDLDRRKVIWKGHEFSTIEDLTRSYAGTEADYKNAVARAKRQSSNLSKKDPDKANELLINRLKRLKIMKLAGDHNNNRVTTPIWNPYRDNVFRTRSYNLDTHLNYWNTHKR